MKKVMFFSLFLCWACWEAPGKPPCFETSLPSNRPSHIISIKSYPLGLDLVVLRVLPALGWSGNGPYGGFASHFLFDARNPGVMYAGSQYAGVFKSTDFGELWFPIGLENTYRTEGLVSPRTDPSVIYENAEFQFVGVPGSPSMVFKSTDYGTTWALRNNGLHSIFYDLAVSPTSPETVYVAGAGGRMSLWKSPVMRTTDGGGSWVLKGFAPDTGGAVVDLVVAEDGFHTVYAGVGFFMDGGFSGGVWRSADAGETWEPRNNGFPSGSEHYWVGMHGGLGINPFNPLELYCGLSSDSGWGLYKTTNRGDLWVSIKPQWPSTRVPNWPTVDRRDTLILYYTSLDSGIAKSTNQGLSWRIVNGSGLPANGRHAGMRCLGQEPWIGQRLWASNARLQSGDGVFVSSDFGESWDQKIQGFSATEVNAVALDPQNPTVLYSATSMGGAYKSTDAGSSWMAINDSLYFPWYPYYNRETLLSMSVARRTPGFVLVGCDGDGVFKTTNGGQKWFYSGQGMPDVMRYTLSVDVLVFDPRSDSVAYAGLCMWQHGGWPGWGVYKTTNAGSGWQRKNSGLGRDTSVTSLALARSAPDILYAGTQRGVYKSTNGADFWQPTGAGPDSVISASVDPWAPQIVYAGTWTRGLFRSTDGGTTWVQRNNGLGSLFVRAIVCDTLHPGRLAVGTGAGVFWSDDWGENWREVGSGLTSAWSLAFQYLPGDSVKIYAGTCSRGVVSHTMAVGVEESPSPFSPSSFRLSVSPNPFRSQAVISVSYPSFPAPHTSPLQIYDPLGRKVRVLAPHASRLTPHEYVWDGRDAQGRLLPSGVYFLRLESGKTNLIRKVVLLR